MYGNALLLIPRVYATISLKRATVDDQNLRGPRCGENAPSTSVSASSSPTDAGADATLRGENLCNCNGVIAGHLEQSRCKQCTTPYHHDNITHSPYFQNALPGNGQVIAAVNTHIMHDLASMQYLNWALPHDSVTNGQGSLHFQPAPSYATVNNGSIAGATSLIMQNMDLLATVATRMATIDSSHGGSSLDAGIASSLSTSSHVHVNTTNSGRIIGRIRRYNETNASYSAWSDIYAGSGLHEDVSQRTSTIDIPLSRGGKIRVHTNILPHEKRMALSKAMKQCKLYRQYSRSQIFNEPRFHVLLSSKAAQSNVGYMYHGIKMKALPIECVPEVASCAKDLARMYKLPHDQWGIGVDLIVYKDGEDSIGWHADDTQGESVVLCVVIDAPGEPRTIRVRPTKRAKQLSDGDEEIQLYIGEGDGYVMDGIMQAGYEHALPKRIGSTAHRFVLIFRHGNEAIVPVDTGVALTEMPEYSQTAISNFVSFLSRMRAKAPLVSFGHPRGVVEGSCHSRRFLFTSRAHRADQRGINGSMKLGSDSIVVSRQDPGLREEDGGGALCLSYSKTHPIRVFRSSNLNTKYAPPELDGGRTSYRYDGLYVVTKAWDANGNLVGAINDGIPAGGTQFTFHLERNPKLELNSTGQNDNYYNRLNLQDLLEKIQLSHGRKHELVLEPRRFNFLDKLPRLLNETVARCNTQSVASSAGLLRVKGTTTMHTYSSAPCHPSTQVFACQNTPSVSSKSDNAETELPMESFPVNDKIAMSISPDAFEELEVFSYSVILTEYWKSFIQLTDNASHLLEICTTRSLRNICGEALWDETMSDNRKRLVTSNQHIFEGGRTQLKSNKRRRVQMPERVPQIVEPRTRVPRIVEPRTRQSVVRFTTNVEEGMQSISQPLEALCCVDRRRKVFRQVKVTVKWCISGKRRKTDLCDFLSPDGKETTYLDDCVHEASEMTPMRTSPRFAHIADANSPALTTFNVKEKIYAWDKYHLYEAKVLKVKEDARGGCAKYLVHYKGYSKSHDKWLTSSALLKNMPAVRKYFRMQG